MADNLNRYQNPNTDLPGLGTKLSMSPKKEEQQ
jgi:hypothetical protein